LGSGKWLDELPLDSKPEAKQTQSIQALLPGDGQAVVLTATTDDDRGLEGTGQLISYQVNCFKAGETRPLWSKSFPSAGKVARPGVGLLWAARAPDKVQPDVQPLTRLGDDILVCAGPVQDLLCLKSDTGERLWRTERVWEFERGFIGPSVWQHFIARGGVNDMDKKVEAPKDEKEENLPPTRQYAIVGGPVVVEIAKGRDRAASRSIFVAVAKGPARYAEYLSDCVIYELGADGKPLRMVTVPRMVRGGSYQVQKDGLVWACTGGAFVKLGLSTSRANRFGMGPGGPDMLCRIDWYRQLAVESPSAWLISSSAGNPLAFSDGLAFQVIAGGYVKDEDATVYNFPIAMVDLKTRTDRSLLLNVPFKGKVPKPKTNFSSTTSQDGKQSLQTLGPHLLAITWLAVEGKQLVVTLGMENESRTLEFNIDGIDERNPK